MKVTKKESYFILKNLFNRSKGNKINIVDAKRIQITDDETGEIKIGLFFEYEKNENIPDSYFEDTVELEEDWILVKKSMDEELKTSLLVNKVTDDSDVNEDEKDE